MTVASKSISDFCLGNQLQWDSAKMLRQCHDEDDDAIRFFTFFCFLSFLISILLFFFVSSTTSKLDTMHAKVACLIFLLHVFISLETELSSNSIVRHC